MYETIVFDLDGTLLDTLDDLTDSVNASLEKFNLPKRTKNEVRACVGNGIAKLVQRAAGEENKALWQDVLTEFKKHYAVHCADKTAPYEGILPLLRALKARGIKTAVLSNKADFAVKSLAGTYFEGLLQAAVGENEEAGIRKKPAPDSLFAVMQAFGVTKEETLFVGDSEVDIQTGKNAGVDCVSVSWGFKDEEFLQANGAEKIISRPMQLLESL